MPNRAKASLKDLRKRLQDFQGLARVGSSDARGDLIATMGAAIMRETLAGFRESRDPYGNPWAGVDRQHGAGKPLIKTGALRASTTLEVTGSGFRVAIADPVAKFHQFGTHARRRRSANFSRARANARRLGKRLGPGGIRPRPMLPDAARGLPANWQRIMDRVCRTVLARHSKVAA